MAFTRKTNSIPLFASSGDYHAEAKLSYSKNESKRTFTVTVEGIRAYCKYGWNFGSNIVVWLGTSSNGSGKVQKTGKISASGSNSYKGWLPKSGYAKITVSKTFNYNDDGSVPTVYLYFKAYNDSVKWINAGKKTPVNVSYGGNIKSEIAKIGPKDVTPPTVTASFKSANPSTISWNSNSNATVSEWKYRLNGGNWNNFGSAGKTSSGSVNVKPGQYTIEVCGKKSSNGKWGYSSKVSYDTRLPTITSKSIEVTASNSGILHFKSNFKCDYTLTATNYSTGWIKSLSANTDCNKSISLINNKDITYTLTVRRSDNSTLSSSTTIKADSRVPSVRIIDFKPTSKTTGDLYIRSSLKYEYNCSVNGKWLGWSNTINANVTSAKNLTLPSNRETTVTVLVRRSDNHNLTTQTTYKCDLKRPTITTLKEIDATSNGKTTLKFTSNYTFNYRYHNGIKWSTWSGVIAANKQCHLDISVPEDKITDVKLEVRRTYADCLDASTNVKVDSKLPDVINPRISVTGYTTGTLTYQSTFNTTYEIVTTKKYTGNLNANVKLSKEVLLSGGLPTTYKLKVSRYKKPNLYVIVPISADTRKPDITEKTYVINSTTSVQLIVNSSYAYQWRYGIPTKSWSAWSQGYNGNTRSSKTITLPEDTETTVKIQLRRFDNNNLITESEQKIDLKLPKIKNLTKELTGKNKGKLSFTCPYDYEYTFRNTVNNKSIKSNVTTEIKNINLVENTNKSNNFNLVLRRAHSDKLTVSKSVNFDTKLPSINDLEIENLSYTRVQIKFKSDYDVICNLYDNRGTRKLNYTQKANECIKKRFTVPINTYTNYKLEVKRNDQTYNNVLISYNNNILIDTLEPMDVDNSIQVNGFESGKLSITPRFDAIIVHKGTRYNVSATTTKELDVELSKDTKNGIYPYIISRQKYPDLTVTRYVKYDTSIPTANITVLPTSSDKASVTVKNCSHKCKLSAIHPSIKTWYTWGTTTEGSQTITGVRIQDNYCDDYTVRLSRSDVPAIYKEYTKTVDSILPTVTDLFAQPKVNNCRLGTFSGIFNKEVIYEVYDKRNKLILNSTQSTTNTRVSSNPFEITSINNVNDYHLKIYRTTNKNLYKSYYFKLDCRPPEINLVSIDIKGNEAIAKFKNESNVDATNVYLHYIDLNTDEKIEVKHNDISPQQEYTVTIPQEGMELSPGQNYMVYVTGERVVTALVVGDVKYTYKLRCQSNIKEFISQSSVWIKCGNKFKSSVVHIFDDNTKEWKDATPYVYIKENDDDPGYWKRTR